MRETGRGKEREVDKSVSLQRCSACFAVALLCWQNFIHIYIQKCALMVCDLELLIYFLCGITFISNLCNIERFTISCFFKYLLQNLLQREWLPKHFYINITFIAQLGGSTHKFTYSRMHVLFELDYSNFDLFEQSEISPNFHSVTRYCAGNVCHNYVP